MFEKLKKLLADEFDFDTDEITMDTALDDMDIDSLSMVEILMAIEEDFGIGQISEEEAAGLKTVGDVVDLINSKS